MEQGTPEWIQARIGKVTASRMADLLAKTKNGYGASRANLMASLIAERLTGQPNETYTSAAMQWGVDHEDEARSAYEFFRDTSVEKSGFFDHPTIPMSGASPDGLIASDGLVEIKCPNTATHIETLISGTVPGKYVTQMFWQMACTARKWCDFVSYDPRMPQHLRLFVRRVESDAVTIREMESETLVFLKEMDEKLHELSKLTVA